MGIASVNGAKPVLKLGWSPCVPDSALPEKWKLRREAVDTLLCELIGRFPNAFRGRRASKRLLKVGIREDVKERAPDLDGKLIGWAIGVYTRGTCYREMMVAGAIRVDLDGNPAGVVTAEEAAEAIRHLKKLRAVR